MRVPTKNSSYQLSSQDLTASPRIYASHRMINHPMFPETSLTLYTLVVLSLPSWPVNRLRAETSHIWPRRIGRMGVLG